MRILIVAATQPEIEPLFLSDDLLVVSNEIGLKEADLPLATHELKHRVHLLTTGVGMVATAFAMGRHLATHHYDLAINLGIAGSFEYNIALGEVVEVTTDRLAEFGAEDDEDFLSVEQLGFGESSFNAGASLHSIYEQFHITDNRLKLRQTTGITVNTVHGNEQAIRKIKGRLSPQIETMEGAAFFYACRRAGLPCLQIRAVSNYVEKRNRDSWKVGLAIKNLNTFADKLIKLMALH